MPPSVSPRGRGQLPILHSPVHHHSLGSAGKPHAAPCSALSLILVSPRRIQPWHTAAIPSTKSTGLGAMPVARLPSPHQPPQLCGLETCWSGTLWHGAWVPAGSPSWLCRGWCWGSPGWARPACQGLGPSWQGSESFGLLPGRC